MKKLLNALLNGFNLIMGLLSVTMLVFAIGSALFFDQQDRSFFGYQSFIVLSDSMSATDFDAGDLIITQKGDTSTLEEGDIIAFISQSEESYGQVLTHKIRSVLVDKQTGSRSFITYGTTTDTNDSVPVQEASVLGKYTKAIPNVGKILYFLKTVPGYLLCILLPFGILFAMELRRILALYREYQYEKNEEARLEKEALLEKIRMLESQNQPDAS